MQLSHSVDFYPLLPYVVFRHTHGNSSFDPLQILPNAIPCLLRTRMSGLFFVARLTPFGLRAPKNDRSPRSALLQQGAAGGAAFVFSTRPPGKRRKNKSCDDLPLERGGRLDGWTVFRALFISPVTDQPKTDASPQLCGQTVFGFPPIFGKPNTVQPPLSPIPHPTRKRWHCSSSP